MEPGRKSPKREICRSKASRWASRAGRESGINGTPPPSVSYTLGYMPQKKKHAHANFHVPHPSLTLATPVIYSDGSLGLRQKAVLGMRENKHHVPETVERVLDSTLESVESAEELALSVAQRAGFDRSEER